ncbi:MAG: hypothetical protein HY535_07145, partial [Chloroflexi bacterium]|nr:hypothetical protein [Chloroflexota bacterium]
SRRLEISPTQGPVGTTITVKVTGMGRGAFDSTASVLYDNRFTGFVSTVTTGGTAVFQIRAAGAPGTHYIQLQNASHALPYLNTEQSPPLYAPGLRTEFTVTPGSSLPPPRLDWPDPGRVAPLAAAIPRTMATGRGQGSGVTASLSSTAGTILSKTALKVNSLGPEAPVAVFYGTAVGNDVTGWNVSDFPLGQGKADRGGSFDSTVDIPDDLGGWHSILVQSGDKIVAEVPYYVQRSLVEVTPTRVKAGEQFMVRIKGVGWTALDNGVAVTYDNAYVGYACGFCCKGDTQIFLTATGGPGIHLVELYPMIYDSGQNKWPWQYNIPQLTALQDHPGLGLGYNLPIFRLAIEVVP